jgi:hypothetical protein
MKTVGDLVKQLVKLHPSTPLAIDLSAFDLDMGVAVKVKTISSGRGPTAVIVVESDNV